MQVCEIEILGTMLIGHWLASAKQPINLDGDLPRRVKEECKC